MKIISFDKLNDFRQKMIELLLDEKIDNTDIVFHGGYEELSTKPVVHRLKQIFNKKTKSELLNFLYNNIQYKEYLIFIKDGDTNLTFKTI